LAACASLWRRRADSNSSAGRSRFIVTTGLLLNLLSLLLLTGLASPLLILRPCQ
jgi:hypothetical protein